MAPPQQPHQAPAASTSGSQNPVAPSVPVANLQAIILRLTHAIHDIDAFQNLLAAGAQTGSMPTWDNILERYSLLLSRIQALQTYLARPPNQPTSSRPTDPPPSTDPLLSKYLVHPLNPLRPVEEGVNPIAHDILEWVLSTLPNPSLAASQTELLNPAGSSRDLSPDEKVQAESGGQSGSDSSSREWKTLDELKALPETQLNSMSKDLRERLRRETMKAQAIRNEIESKESEIEWEMRILDDEAGKDEDEADGGKEQARAMKGAGDGESDEDDIVMVDGPSAPQTVNKKKKSQVRRPENLQQDWSLVDYLRFLDAGRKPVSAAS